MHGEQAIAEKNLKRLKPCKRLKTAENGEKPLARFPLAGADWVEKNSTPKPPGPHRAAASRRLVANC
jgi:hypothetical protein